MTPETGAKVYLKRLKEQIECYNEIVNISKRQHQLIEEGSFEKLPGRVREREKVLKKLDILQYVTKAYSEYWTKVAWDVNGETNEDITKALDKLKDVLKELESYDQELKVRSTTELEKIKKELALVKCNRVKLKGFQKPISKPNSIYVNRLSVAL